MRIIIGTIFLVIVGGLFVIFKPLSPVDFVEWVEDYDNGWHQKIQKDDWLIDVQREPLAYVALHKYGKSLTTEILDKFIAEQDGEEFFLIRISRIDGKDLIDYYGKEEREAALNYYSYKFQDALKLYDIKGAEINPSLFHFERDNTLKPERSFLVSFDTSDSDKIIKMSINSSLLSMEPIEISISNTNLPDFAL